VSRTGAIAWVAVLLGTGCASALKEPPPLSTLQRGPAGMESAPELLEEADREYARRPDLAAVRRAEGLCLAAAQVDESGIDGLVCAARAKSWLAERETNVATRTDLAVSAVQVGQWCLRRAPGSAACKFWLAVALGLQARDRPSTVEDGLKRMAQLLREVAAQEPLYDQGGPDRVLAILQIKAPGWPVGPGDPEEALVHAARAVELRPDYPPNQLALGEVLLKNDERERGRVALLKAVDLAGKAPWSADPDAPGWIVAAKRLVPR
jgi:hypothetical protein